MPRIEDYLEADLGTAAFLIVRGFRLLGLVPDGGRRYAFRFEDPQGDAAEGALAYLRGDAVPAKALVAAMRDLKTLLYARKENGNGNYHTERSNRTARENKSLAPHRT